MNEERITKNTSSNLIKNNNCSKHLRFIDLFTGIGGIRQGFEDENTECVFSSEWGYNCYMNTL